MEVLPGWQTREDGKIARMADERRWKDWQDGRREKMGRSPGWQTREDGRIGRMADERRWEDCQDGRREMMEGLPG